MERVYYLLGVDSNAIRTIEFFWIVFSHRLFHVHKGFIIVDERVGELIDMFHFKETRLSIRIGHVRCFHLWVELIVNGETLFIRVGGTIWGMVLVEMGVDVIAFLGWGWWSLSRGWWVLSEVVMGLGFSLFLLLLSYFIVCFFLDLVHFALDTVFYFIWIVHLDLFTAFYFHFIFLTGCTYEFIIVYILNYIIVFILLLILFKIINFIYFRYQMLFFLYFYLLIITQIVILKDILKIIRFRKVLTYFWIKVRFYLFRFVLLLSLFIHVIWVYFH